MTTRLPLLVAVLGITCAVSLTAAPPGEIRLDLHAFRDGTPETHIQAGDIAVFEDGVAQSVQDVRDAGGGPRTVVVFVDTWHMPFEGARDVRVPLVRLLERWLRDDDHVAVVVSGVTAPGTLSFSAKADAITALDRDEAWEHAVSYTHLTLPTKA